MHILLLPSWYPDCPEDVKGVFFRDQAQALLNHGQDVGVIAPQLRSSRTLFRRLGKPVTPFFEVDAGIPTYRVEVFGALPRVPYGNYWLFKRAARVLFRHYVKQHGRPDVIHAHAAVFAGAAAADIARECGVPIVLTEHSTGFARALYASWQLKLAEKAIVGAGSRISVSPSLGEFLGKQFPSSKGQWQWIPNVVADRFHVPKSKNKRGAPVKFLNLALMTEKKGQMDLIKAFKDVTRNNQSAELWLAGDGPIRTALEKKAGELGISGKVRFLGMVSPENVPELFGKVDVMVVSSHYETFGVVAAEALMAGLPVIATRCGGPECIVGKGDGLLVPVRNPEALGNAMQELLRNFESFDLESIAVRARERFSGPAVAHKLTDEYKRVVESNNYKINRE